MGIIENEVLAYLKKFDDYSFDVELNKKVFSIGRGESSFKMIFKEIPDVYDLLDSTTLALAQSYISGNLEIESYDEQNKLPDTMEVFLGQHEKLALKKKKRNKNVYKSKALIKLKSEIDKFSNLQNDEKINSLLDKMDLHDEMLLCDIGCRYEQILITAAQKFKVKGLMIVFNKKRKQYIDEIISEKGLEDCLEVRCIPLSKISKIKEKFDRIICINEINYVKQNRYGRFFKNLKSLLKEDGKLIMEAMHNPYGYNKDPWVSKYISAKLVYPDFSNLLHKASENGFKIKSVTSLEKDYNLVYFDWYRCILNAEDILKDTFKSKDIRIWEVYICAYAVAFKLKFLCASLVIFRQKVEKKM